MYTQSYLRYLLSDDVSLQQYYANRQRVTLDDIERALMLYERENNRHIPDHYYRLGKEKSFRDIGFISELFTVGLKRLANEYLELRNGVVYVKADQMNNWQLMLPYLPPMLMVCVMLWNEHTLEDGLETDYINRWLIPNVAFTTYPSPYIPQLNELLEQGGFTDLHMHLNGALETDLTWQDFLRNPLEIKNELDKAYFIEKVKEQYVQSSMLANPDRLYNLLKTASVIRYLLYCYAYETDIPNEFASFEDLLNKVADGQILSGYYSKHPLELILGNGVESHYLECVFYIKILQQMSLKPDDDTLSGLFHYYLLILGLTNKMLVQQPSNYGFEEFQKITLNGLREYSESKSYFRRFAQLSGNQLRNVKLLEGRFSPKDNQSKNEAIIGCIFNGWKELRKTQLERNQPESALRLVAHFIKRKETHDDSQIRYKHFREDIDHRADLLLQILQDNTSLSKSVLGIDAAASEFDTPPEVFAPTYRKLRSGGYRHFTYHAGEDFFHVLSGLRTIYEAITFLDLRRCDRIGHATAAGIPIALWKNNIGDKMLIKKGEHLDNLIFAYHMISQKDNERLKSFLPMLSLRIDELGYEIYQDYYPVSMHMKAWQMRYMNPSDVVYATDNEPVKMLFTYYHKKEIAARYDEIEEIDTYDVLGEEQLTELQLMLLAEMHRREIVIETLPTSNVVIGSHHNFNTYHLYNWYLWKKAGKPLPPIVVGTDDIGIFATNIYNEYCNIFCQFVYGKGMNTDEVTLFLKELDMNAKLYAFD